jgi:hypothetical protein
MKLLYGIADYTPNRHQWWLWLRRKPFLTRCTSSGYHATMKTIPTRVTVITIDYTKQGKPMVVIVQYYQLYQKQEAIIWDY